jgi:very-short-patch-repair endonuclease
MAQTVKLAEALLRRKELAAKVTQLQAINTRELFETKVRRQQVAENIDDVVASVPKLVASQVTAEYDHYAQQLRVVDAAIQQANWSVDVSLPDAALQSYMERFPSTK